ncbi:GNAT family N-acetyltransferase [Virgibacillus soli]|uniref:GNAT family N-acetyltransferase n=1 Tax=Paracerasibacillus soli TaxID=480284 RepID=UPI0035ED190A
MQIEIVKYDERYAAKVADMWNNSRDGWGGANTVDTEESILHREASSTNIHTYLALEGDLVVGYCGLSEYREDEGALYIPLLNVRDDYHGKKIGKKLLLTALQEAIQLKWPRLDLYTWPGNTKAVPLYKKCGFFWEDRDDTTHLMNFMPTVLHTAAIQDFFNGANWYDMSTREIEVKPDGQVENDFHYYEYAWKREDEALRIEFERTGRGIRLIETNDYSISATVENRQLVFGKPYTILYNIHNKSGKPLHIDLAGISDKNIQFHLQKEIEVTDTTQITGTFFVDAIQEEQDTFKTHPTVQTTVGINGKQAMFKVGILPKYPAQIKAILPDDVTFVGKRSIFYMDITNNFRERACFELRFPTSPLLELSEQTLQVAIEPKEKVSIPVPFLTKSHGYYHAPLDIKAVKDNGEEIHFTKEVGIPLRGIGATFHGEDEDYIQLYSGQYFATLDKSDHTVLTGKKKKESRLTILTPMLGKPYSEELAKTKPTAIQYVDGAGFSMAKVTFELAAFPAIKLHMFLKLFSDGLLENYYEVENMQDVRTSESIWLNQPIYFDLDRATIPYDGKMVEMNDSVGNSYEEWDENLISENWLFVNDHQNPLGMCWHPEDNIHFDSWSNYFEYQFGKIAGKSTVKTNAIYFSIGAFHDVDTFRSFANQSASTTNIQTVQHLHVSLDNNNPFVIGEKAICKVKDYKSNYLHGELSLSLSPTQAKLVEEQFHREEQKTEWLAELPLENIPAITTINLKATLDAVIHERETLIVKQKHTDMKAEVVTDKGLETWTIDNGIIQFKATPTFFPSLHCFAYKGEEWLDTSFPKLKPKLWWNPWSGGLWSGLSAIRPYSLSKEQSTAAFASLIDNKGNKWKGIKLTTSIRENEAYKGLTYHQYFLTLPGVPILCHVSEINQGTGTYFDQKNWHTGGFFNPGEHMAHNWARTQDKNGDWIKIIAGKGELESIIERDLIIGCSDKKEHIQIITNSKDMQYTYINKEVLANGISERMSIPTGNTQFTTPIFYVFHDRTIPPQAQQDLKNIKF